MVHLSRLVTVLPNNLTVSDTTVSHHTETAQSFALGLVTAHGIGTARGGSVSE